VDNLISVDVSKAFGYSLHFLNCVGKLRNAAENKEDEQILKNIRGKDCSCIEVRYHKSCYNDYVGVLKKNDCVGKKYVAVL
jgi:hypothetical protein